MKNWINILWPIKLFWLFLAFPVFAQDFTLEQKIGQMLIIGFKGKYLTEDAPIVNDILQQRIGGVILFDYNFQTKTYDKNIENPTQTKQLIQQLQYYAKQAAEKHRNGLLPLLISVDYEGGKVDRLKEHYGFPPTYSAKELGKPHQALATQIAADYMGYTLRKLGFNVNYAPVVDLEINPDSPAIGKLGRSFSAQPAIVIERTQHFTQALTRHNVLCVYKHFPGHGSATGDTHEGFVDVTKSWQEIELQPYQVLLANPQHCPLVMSAHVVNRKLDPKGYPATLSKTILTGKLRHEFGFQGIIISDDMQMKAITEQYSLKEAVKLAIQAGVDILVFGNQLDYQPEIAQKVITVVKELIEEGELSQERIDLSFNRILQIKKQLQQNSPNPKEADIP